MQILGVTLIAAALVIPAITARLLTDSFSRMMLRRRHRRLRAASLGMYFSYYLDVASGATIVLLQAAIFCVALTISGLRHQAGGRLTHVHVD
jgi:ABC-type Mn2+/Zn2+ transport system permease subunit